MTQDSAAIRQTSPAPAGGYREQLFRWSSRWFSKAPRGQFWFYFAAATLFGFGLSVYFFLFNIYLLDFGLTERSLGLIGSVMAAGSICGTIPVGVLAERIGLRWTLAGGLMLALMLLALRPFVVWLPAQLLLAAPLGVGICSLGVCLPPLIAALTREEERPLGFSLIFAWGVCTNGLGTFVASRLPGILRADFFPLLSRTAATRDTLLFGCGVAALALIPLSQLRLTERPVVSRARMLRPSSRFLRRFLAAMALWSLVTGSFAPFANVYFVHHLGVSLEKAGSIFRFSQVVGFLALISAPLLFRRTGLTPGIMLTQLATAVSLAALAGIHTAAKAAAVYWLYMAFQSMNEPGIYSLLMERTPEQDRKGASALTFFVSAIAQALASLVVGAAIVRFGYSAMLVVIAAIAAAAAMLFRSLPGEKIVATGSESAEALLHRGG